MFSNLARLAPALLAAACLSGCASWQKTPTQFTPHAGERAAGTGSEPRLRSGDTLEIRLGGVPYEEVNTITGTYAVDSEGYVNMPHIGRIKAEGLTQSALQQAIESAYVTQKVYTNPTITVNVPMQARFVNVGGEVRLPQRIAYTSDLTVFSAISAAGGFSEYAAQSRVHVMRGHEMINVDIRKIRKNPELDIPLEPGDSIEVMRSFF